MVFMAIYTSESPAPLMTGQAISKAVTAVNVMAPSVKLREEHKRLCQASAKCTERQGF